MGIENFTLYTKVDPGSDITVAADSITVATMRRDVTSYVKYSYPAGTFGNFTHTLDMNWTAASADSAAAGIWGLSNSSYVIVGAGIGFATNAEGLQLVINRTASNQYRLYVVDRASGASDFINWTSAPGWRYLLIQRIGGLLTCLIYTNSSRTTLEDAISVACAVTTYTNVVPVASVNTPPVDAPDISFVTANLDVQFTAPAMVTAVSVGEGGMVARASSISSPTQQARRPYLSLKQSMKDFFSEHVRYLKNQNQIESAFEKPYLSADYPTMHFDIPDPNWPSWTWPKRWRPGNWTVGGDVGGGAHPVLDCPGCALYADPPIDCNSPVEIHSGIWCTNTPGAQTKDTIKMPVHGYTGNSTQDAQSERASSARVDGVTAGDTKLYITAKEGVIKSISIGAWATIGPSAAVIVDSTVAHHIICGRMVDGAKNVCEACVDVLCACNCATATAFSIDGANTDTTVAPGGTANIAVLGGCTPITWTVSGNGYVLTTLVTQGRTNIVTATPGTCGNGSGQHAAYCIITATDACGTGVSVTIKSTDGKWTNSFSYGVNFTNCLGCTNCAPGGSATASYITVDNITRWAIQYFAFSGDGVLKCVRNSGGACSFVWGNGANPLPPAPCTSAQTCADTYWPGPCTGAGCTGTCAPGSNRNAVDSATKQTWTC